MLLGMELTTNWMYLVRRRQGTHSICMALYLIRKRLTSFFLHNISLFGEGVTD